MDLGREILQCLAKLQKSVYPLIQELPLIEGYYAQG